MEPSTMDLNRSAVAPNESTSGARRPGFCALRQIPLFGAPKWILSKNWEMGGARVLGGCCLVGRHNNQPNDGVGGEGGYWEETRPGGTCGGGCLLVVLGDELSDEKIGAMSFDGFHFQWMGGYNNQPKVGHHNGMVR
jgi:hypothetical protein